MPNASRYPKSNTAIKNSGRSPGKVPFAPEKRPKPLAKKSLGQNFLQDANIARKIVASLEIAPGDSVLEIGPGPGALSVHVEASNPSWYLLLEKDSAWAAFHAEQRGLLVQYSCAAALQSLNTAAARGRVVLEGDALHVPWETFTTPWKAVGNLPYNVASPMMWELFSRIPQLQRAVFMVQKEVGERLAAEPGSGKYGALSVWVQSFVRPRIEFIVPPQVFYPRPKVHSAVVSFVPVGSPGTFVPEALAAFLKTCFQSRRKQLGSVFKGDLNVLDALQHRGIALTARPETLSPADFHFVSSCKFSASSN